MPTFGKQKNKKKGGKQQQQKQPQQKQQRRRSTKKKHRNNNNKQKANKVAVAMTANDSATVKATLDDAPPPPSSSSSPPPTQVSSQQSQPTQQTTSIANSIDVSPMQIDWRANLMTRVIIPSTNCPCTHHDHVWNSISLETFKERYLPAIDFLFAKNNGVFPMVQGAIDLTLNTYPQFQLDIQQRSIMKEILLSIGTNVLLWAENVFGSNVDNAWKLANSLALFISNMVDKGCYYTLHNTITHANMKLTYEAKEELMTCLRTIKAKRDLSADANGRTTTKMFLKENECDCLHEVWKNEFVVKTKTACCQFCLKLTDYMSLKECAGCRYFHYCNKECQVSHWQTHKAGCNSCYVIRKKVAEAKSYPVEID